MYERGSDKDALIDSAQDTKISRGPSFDFRTAAASESYDRGLIIGRSGHRVNEGRANGDQKRKKDPTGFPPASPARNKKIEEKKSHVFVDLKTRY